MLRKEKEASNPLTKKAGNTICTTFVDYCEHGKPSLRVLHFELRYLGTTFKTYAKYGDMVCSQFCEQFAN